MSISQINFAFNVLFHLCLVLLILISTWILPWNVFTNSKQNFVIFFLCSFMWDNSKFGCVAHGSFNEYTFHRTTCAWKKLFLTPNSCCVSFYNGNFNIYLVLQFLVQGQIEKHNSFLKTVLRIKTLN